MAQDSSDNSSIMAPNSEDMVDGDKKPGHVDVREGEEIIIEDGLRRGLLGRHVFSLVSVIGATCFYGFGYALYLSGPVGAILGFGIVG